MKQFRTMLGFTTIQEQRLYARLSFGCAGNTESCRQMSQVLLVLKLRNACEHGNISKRFTEGFADRMDYYVRDMSALGRVQFAMDIRSYLERRLGFNETTT